MCMVCTVIPLVYRGRLPRSLAMRSLSSDLSPKHSCSLMVQHLLSRLIVALAYLDSGKVKVKGIVNKTFTIDQWDECLEAMRNKSAIKAAIVFE